MEFRVLGPFEVAEEGAGVVSISAAKERALLLVLVLHANEVVPAERLIDELWGERAARIPRQRRCRRTCPRLRNSASGRRITGADRDPRAGYELSSTRTSSTRTGSSGLVAGRGEARRGRPGGRAPGLEEALALWRGAPLAELAYEPFAQAEIARLEDLRVAAFEQATDARAGLGHHADGRRQLEALVGEHPFRERLRAQLMLALYRAGRQAEALRGVSAGEADARGRARHRAGPSAEAARRADPESGSGARSASPYGSTIARPAHPEVAGRSPRRLRARACDCNGSLPNPGDRSSAVPPNSVGLIEASTAKLAASIAVGPTPSLIAYGGTAHHRQLWVANAGDQTLTRIDTRTRKASGPVVSLRATPAGLVVGFGAVWVLDKDVPQLLRIDPEVGRVIETFPLPLAGPGYFPVGIAVGDGSLWAAYDTPGQLVRIDPVSGHIVKTIHIGSPTAIAYGAGAVWIGGP